MRLKDKVCVVTGGGSGIGKATCLVFAREGAALAVADKNPQTAEATAAAAREAGREAIALGADVAKSADIRHMLDETLARFGRVDVLVNNAGYGIAGSVVETDEDAWNALIAVNLTGVFLACKHTIPIMAKQGGGVIVNVASVVANIGITDRAAYCASKGGVAALTRAMALDHVGQGVRVNAIAPGTIDSAYFKDILAKSPDPDGLRRGLEDRQAMRRLGTPEEVANGILYLACEESAFCTGSVLTVDGGMTAH